MCELVAKAAVAQFLLTILFQSYSYLRSSAYAFLWLATRLTLCAVKCTAGLSFCCELGGLEKPIFTHKLPNRKPISYASTGKRKSMAKTRIARKRNQILPFSLLENHGKQFWEHMLPRSFGVPWQIFRAMVPICRFKRAKNGENRVAQRR